MIGGGYHRPGTAFQVVVHSRGWRIPMRAMSLILFTICLSVPARAATVVVEADRDTTLIEHPDGALANGSGPFLYAGRTNQGTGSVRRALVRFDVGSAVPENAVIQDAVLVLAVTPGNPGPRVYRLHPVLDEWGEGASSSGGGGGAPAQPADATWIHTFHDLEFWSHNGGQFLGIPSAEAVLDGPGVYRFDGPGILRDVRVWSRRPGANHGWILIGDETTRQTVKSLASRENPDPSLRPVLEITYRTRP
jgi:hypothetical protein